LHSLISFISHAFRIGFYYPQFAILKQLKGKNRRFALNTTALSAAANEHRVYDEGMIKYG